MFASLLGKIAGTMVLAVVALGVAVMPTILDARSELDALDRTGAALDQLDDLHRAARAVGHERLSAALADLPDPPPELPGDERPADLTDRALEPIVGGPGALSSAVEAIAAARSTPVKRSDNYRRASTDLLEAAGDVVVDTDDAATVRSIGAIRTVHELIDATDRVWIGFAERVSDEDRVVAELLAGFATAELLGDQVAGEDGGPIGPVIDEVVAGTGVMNELRVAAIEDLLNPAEQIVTPEAALYTLADARQRWTRAAERMEAELDDHVAGLRTDARSRRNTAAVLALFGILGIGAAGAALHGAATGPLGAVADDAERFVDHGAPALAAALDTSPEQPPSVPKLGPPAGTELRRMVAAVNRSNEVLEQLATTQARARHNLSRRAVTLSAKNTRLLHELVRLVASWRSTDETPETRARLFQIDHLATRMQRTTEALLLLSGSHAERHWTHPISATNTARLALGELGAFDRVDIGEMGDVRIRGAVAPDVAHLLAELIENALGAADPRKGPQAQRVQVQGMWVSAGFAFIVRDQARGMDDDQRATINRRLHTPVVAHEGPTDFLGLYIVAHLAQRHGIDVRYLEAPEGGSIARVSLPVDLVDPATVPPDRNRIDAGRSTAVGQPAPLPEPGEAQQTAAREFFGDGDEAPARAPAAPVTTPTAGQTSPLVDPHDLNAELAALVSRSRSATSADPPVTTPGS